MLEKMLIDLIILLLGKSAVVGIGYFQRWKVVRIDAEGQKPGRIVNALKGDILRTSEGRSQRTDEGGQMTGTGTRADYLNLTNRRFFGDPSNLFLFGSFLNQSFFSFLVFFFGYDTILIGFIKILQFLSESGGYGGWFMFSFFFTRAAGNKRHTK